jgi:intein/homing endonuclease
MSEKSITEFLSDEYKDFSLYVIENRAIPSVIDGLKPTQRKIVHICNDIWKTGNEKTLKVFQLAGKVASDAFYHHGNCLEYDTEIITSDGEIIKIGEWFEKYPDLKLDLISYDENESKYVTGIGHSPRVGTITTEEYEIEMEDGNIFKCTENHPFYTTNRGWVKAEDLTNNDDIKDFHHHGGKR